jgi:hypothetical protein
MTDEHTRIDSLLWQMTYEEILAVGQALGLDMRNAAADFDIPLSEDFARVIVKRRMNEIADGIRSLPSEQ